jgi:hypothetical protein
MRTGPFLVTLFCLFIFTESISQSAVCAYKYRKRIRFEPAQVSGAADLSNFTALINITTDNDLRHTSSSGHVDNLNGFDIIFVADDGVTALDFQLEKYTSTTGELVAWVRIPTLYTTEYTYIYMYYGNIAIAADQSSSATWNSNYKGVWHLHNSVFTDGTATGNNGTNGGSTNLATAKIAGGRTFSGAGTNYLQLPLTGMNGGNGNGSLSFWGRITAFTNSTYFFGESTTQNATYTNRLQLYFGDASGNLYLGLGATHALQSNVQTMALNTWYHVALTWISNGASTGNYTIYVNGVQKGTGAYTGWSAIHTFGDAGNDGNAGQRTEELPGNVDEVHVTSTALWTDWFLTEYNNQNSPSTFYTISTEPKIWNGTSNSNYNAAANWATGAPGAGDDVLINSSANQPALQSNEQVNSIFVRTGAVLSLGNNNLSVRSDVTNCGVINAGTGILTMNSATVQSQNMSGSGTYNLTNLTINNTFTLSPSVTLNKDVNVSGAFALTSGTLYTTNTNILALGSAATSGAGSAASFVSGPVSKTGNTNFVFPIGKGASRWRRAALSNLTASATFRAEYFYNGYTNNMTINSPLDNVSHIEYWQVDLISGSANANLSLYWENATGSGVTNCPDLTIARWNGSSWDERPGTTVGGSTCSGAGTGIITSNAVITAFSPFTFGSRLYGINPLPVELTDFSAVCDEDGIHVKWSTASERENDHFVIEKSTDGNTWLSVSEIPGKGNSGTRHNYAYDESPVGELTYYRLVQVNFNASQKIYPATVADCFGSQNSLSVYPNPANDLIEIETHLSQDYGKGQLEVIDCYGRTVVSQSVLLSKGPTKTTLDKQLLPGSYSILMRASSLQLLPQKLIVK